MSRIEHHYFAGKRIWITGASKGIGRALALRLSRYSTTLILTARNREGLDAVRDECSPGGNVLVVPADVGIREQNLKIAETARNTFGGLDIAIFNAGTAEYLDVAHFDNSLFERVMHTNFLSMIYGIEATLPLLRESGTPHLVGMSSTAAYGGLPRSEAYGASKAAVRNMLSALRISLSPEGIPVSVICPGFVRTPLTDKNDFPMPLLIEPDEAARRIAHGLARRVEEIHFPKRFSMALKLIASLPSPLYTRLVRRMVLKK